MCGSSFTRVDASCAMANGIFQIVTGSLSIILSFISVGATGAPGAASGVGAILFLLGGIFMLIAGIKRCKGWIITAFVFAAINLLLSLAASICFLLVDIIAGLSAVVIVVTILSIFQSYLVIWAVCPISCPGCCHCRSDGNAAQQQQQQQQAQPHVVTMHTPMGADGTAPAFILMPVNAGQMPMNPGQAPIYAGQMLINSCQLSVQAGQLQTEVHHVASNSPPPNYDDLTFCATAY